MTVVNGWSKAKTASDKKLEDVAPYKLHDLRRTFTSTPQKLGVPIQVREKITNHISRTQAAMTGIYGVYHFTPRLRKRSTCTAPILRTV